MPLRAYDLALWSEEELAKVHPMWTIKMGETDCSLNSWLFFFFHAGFVDHKGGMAPVTFPATSLSIPSPAIILYHPWYWNPWHFLWWFYPFFFWVWLCFGFLCVCVCVFMSCLQFHKFLTWSMEIWLRQLYWLFIPLSIHLPAHVSDWLSACLGSSKLNKEKVLKGLDILSVLWKLVK